jgi:hypothetical protein
VFNNISDIQGDSIINFTSGEIIDLSGIDWDTSTAGDQAFVMDSNGTVVAGEVGVTVSNNIATVTVGGESGNVSFTIALPSGATELDINFIL